MRCSSLPALALCCSVQLCTQSSGDSTTATISVFVSRQPRTRIATAERSESQTGDVPRECLLAVAANRRHTPSGILLAARTRGVNRSSFLLPVPSTATFSRNVKLSWFPAPSPTSRSRNRCSLRRLRVQAPARGGLAQPEARRRARRTAGKRSHPVARAGVCCSVFWI